MDYFLSALTPNLNNERLYKKAIEEILGYDIITEKYGNLLEEWNITNSNIEIIHKGLVSIRSVIDNKRMSCSMYLSKYPSQCGIAIMHDIKVNAVEAQKGKNFPGFVLIPNAIQELTNLIIDLGTIHSIRCGFTQLRYTATTNQNELMELLINKGWNTVSDIEFINQRTGISIITLYKNLHFVDKKDLGELINE